MCKAKESQHWLCPFIPDNGILKSQTISDFTSGKIQVYVIDIRIWVTVTKKPTV